MILRTRTRIVSLACVMGALAGGTGASLLAQDAAPAQTPAKSAPAAVNDFAVDAVHSTNVFKIMHMGVANFYGRFNEMNGSFTLNTQNPEASTFHIVINPASVDSNNANRDKHLMSPDFFNVAEFPEWSFKSTKVEPVSADALKVTGDLNVHGVTKSVTVPMRITAPRETRQGLKAGMETTFTIKRTDFGMDTYVANGALGDEVTVMVSIEGATKKAEE